MYILKKLLFGLHAHIVPYFLVQLVCRNSKTEDIQKTQVMIIYPAYMYASLCAYLHNIHNTHLCIILDIFLCVCIYAYRKSEMRLKLFQRKPHYIKRGLPPLSQLTHLPHLFFSFSAANSCPTSPRGGHGGLGGLGGNKRVNAENLVQAAYAAMEDKGDIANTGWQWFWVQGSKSQGGLQ